MAEWCQHDDKVIHGFTEPDEWDEYPDAEGGHKITIRAKFAAATDQETMKAWVKDDDNIVLGDTTEYPSVVVTGPDADWKMVHVTGNHGWECIMDTATIFAPGQVVRFNLSNPSKGIIDVNGWS